MAGSVRHRREIAQKGRLQRARRLSARCQNAHLYLESIEARAPSPTLGGSLSFAVPMIRDRTGVSVPATSKVNEFVVR